MASPKNALILYNFNSYNKVSSAESQHLDTLARLGCSGRMHLEKIPEGKIDKIVRNPIDSHVSDRIRIIPAKRH
jgi:hypothetical protein